MNGIALICCRCLESPAYLSCSKFPNYPYLNYESTLLRLVIKRASPQDIKYWKC
jgi:hypothetical protein